jgi:hypothetical protein
MELSVCAKGLISSFAGFAEEGFLLTLTNRGIYNRALKDYEVLAGSISLSEENGDLAASFEDTKVLLKQPVKDSHCSCPAHDTCKHILIALFAARDANATPEQENPHSTEAGDGENFDELENVSFEALKKEAGGKIYRKALHLFLDGYGAVFSEAIGQSANLENSIEHETKFHAKPDVEILAAEVKSDGVTVYFPRKKSLAGAICKCGEKGICIHTLIAVFSYLEKRGLPIAGLDDDGEEEFGDDEAALLEQALQFAVSLFEKGLISADDTDIEAARQFSLKFDAEGIGNLSRLFRGLSTDLENMLSKNSGFNHRVSFGSLSRIFNTGFLILKHRNDREKQKVNLVPLKSNMKLLFHALIEKSRSNYRSIPHGHFTGLGAHPWQTRSGYAGVSCFFYSRERDAVLSYSDSMADFYEKTKDSASIKHLTKSYTKDDHWNPPVSIKTMSEGIFSLKHFKTNDDNRVSSSKETVFFSEGKTGEAACAAIASSLAFQAGDENSYDYFGKRNRVRYALIRTAGIEDCYYDRVRQLLMFELCGEETSYAAIIPYSEINKKAISYIENCAGVGEISPLWFFCQRDKRGLIPLSAIGVDGVHNFYF